MATHGEIHRIARRIVLIMNDKYIHELTEDLRDYAKAFSGRRGTAGYGIAASTAADTIDKLWKMVVQARRPTAYDPSRKTEGKPFAEARIVPNIGSTNTSGAEHG